MKLLIIALLSSSIAATDIAPAFAGYEPPPDIGHPTGTTKSGRGNGSGGGR